MLSSLRAVPLVLAAAFLTAAPAAQAYKVESAYLYYRAYDKPSHGYKGTAWLIVRTDSAIREVHGFAQFTAAIGRDYTRTFGLSRELTCYGAEADVAKKSSLRVGKRVRVRLGAKYSKVLRVRRSRAGYPTGKPLGCDKDPKTAVATSGLGGLPEFEPERVFYTADAGPYVYDITWSGWGTAEAVGEGTYDAGSNVPAGTPEKTEPARIVLTMPKRSAADGYTYYTNECLFRTRDGVYGGRDTSTGKDC